MLSSGARQYLPLSAPLSGEGVADLPRLATAVFAVRIAFALSPLSSATVGFWAAGDAAFLVWR